MWGTVALAVASAPQPAAAQAPAGDSVTGAASFEAPLPGPTTVTLGFKAFSGPSGENPTGTITATTGGEMEDARVTCLHATGNRAVIGLGAPLGPVYLVVIDGGPGGQDSFGPGAATSAPDCATFDGQVAFTPFTGGDVVVFDAQPFPTTKDQCKNGGWRQFGFKNQGQCIAHAHGSRSSMRL